MRTSSDARLTCSPTFRTGSLRASFPGDSDCTRIGSRGPHRRQRAVLGRIGRQCRGRKQLLEVHRNLRGVGRLGRLLRSRCAQGLQLVRAGFPRSADCHLAVRKGALRSHVHYKFGSMLKFVEQTFDLPSLGTTDERANPLADCFDFKQSPRPFKHIAGEHSAAYFLHQPNSDENPDDDW